MDVISQTLYLLDTNMISYIANGQSPAARRNFTQLGKHHQVATSAIAEGEILYGLARKPGAKHLHVSVQTLLNNVQILPWDSPAARAYGLLRAQLSTSGRSLSTMDTLIAAHAVSIDAILVTHDKAFLQVEPLRTIDWATDLV